VKSPVVLQPSPTARGTVLRLLCRWRQVMFAYSAGPLAWSIVAFRNSLVFHSLDKVQTAHCHAMEYPTKNPNRKHTVQLLAVSRLQDSVHPCLFCGDVASHLPVRASRVSTRRSRH